MCDNHETKRPAQINEQARRSMCYEYAVTSSSKPTSLLDFIIACRDNGIPLELAEIAVAYCEMRESGELN